MERSRKVELFDQIRREFEFGCGTVVGVSRKLGVHRRTVRQAIASAIPPDRKRPVRARPQLEPVRAFIDGVLEADLRAPRKQRHTAHRIFVRLRELFPDCSVAERTVREYVHDRKRTLGLLGRDVMIPQSYAWGVEAQVDWYEASIVVDGEPSTAQVFVMRSMASGGAFHRSYSHATQQAFLEAHELAFQYFGGVFARLRYDNLSSAVKRILRGSKREQNERFATFRSHWQFEASFCTPGEGHEKGGVEGEGGYFRRNHLVPVPHVASWSALNDQMLEWSRQDEARVIGDRDLSVGAGMAIERDHLRPLQPDGFGIAEESFAVVDGKGCVSVRTNLYSTPLRVGTRVHIRVLPTSVEVLAGGERVASHPRCYRNRQLILDLEHYLDVLERKPGAFAGSKPLAQWRADGRWTPAFDQMWDGLKARCGSEDGTRRMIELLQFGRSCGYARLSAAIEAALALGATDVAAVRYLVTAPTLAVPAAAPLTAASARAVEHYTRPLPSLGEYDALLTGADGQEAVAR